ncbi:MAG: Atu2307/SP_0267 family LLM class monooxygenase [Chthoniobacterales bacterium]
MQIGIDSFAALTPEDRADRRCSAVERMANLQEEIEVADEAGLDVFGVGEHHRAEFLDSSPVVILAAAAARTKKIRLTSAVTVLSAHDPVRVFQEFATLDLLSAGRAEMVVGRGSFSEAYPLFGLDFADYDSLFTEKLELLLKLRSSDEVTWSGRFRPALSGQGVFPRPVQDPLPVWVGVGGTPASFVRAGVLGLPLMVAIIGGEPARFRPLIDLYREAGAKAGFPPERLSVGVHFLGYVAGDDEEAGRDFFPGWARTFTQIGRERGWGPTTWDGFEAGRSQRGALLVGSAETVVGKLREFDRALGGLARVTFQMSVAELPHSQMLSAIRRLGDEVAPEFRR